MKALEERRKDLMASYPVWKKMTLYQGLASKAAECPNHVFLLVEGRGYTYGEVLREADRISAAFCAMGLARGGCVAVALSNRIEFVTITFALAQAGAVKVPVNRNASLRAVSYTHLVHVPGGGKNRSGGKGQPRHLHFHCSGRPSGI